MAGPTQLWPGERMRTFFRSLFREEKGVDDALADRLAEVCERHINRMLVWNAQPAAPANKSKTRKTARPTQQEATAKASCDDSTAPATDDADPLEDVAETEAGAPWSMEHLETADESEAEVADESVGSRADEPAFDPFAFSVVVVLARSGADALLEQLETIDDAAHLRELADAQHLGVDVKVRDAKALRKAIVKGAKQRLADRRAAAS